MLARVKALSGAEDVLEILGVPYEPKVLNTSWTPP
ncbi:hypothetical protein I6F07_31495 [Ensifer sp. IC4062]|nr:hypothetical protein [Ensifer sp. IC4062]